MKKFFCVILDLALLPCAVTFPLSAAPSVVSVYEDGNSDPLTIYVASDLSAQVSYDQSNWQVNPPAQQLADSGFFASFSEKVYGPDFGSHPGTSVPDTQYPTPWTLLDQDGNPDGNGILGDPWKLDTTVESPDGSLKVKQTVTYVNGEDEAALEWEITNKSGVELDCWFTHAAAMYMQGDGNAKGYYDSATGAVGGYKQTPWYEQMTPEIPAPSAYEVSEYGTIWSHIIGDPPGFGIGLQNYVNQDYIPIAAGLQWNVTLPASGGTITIGDKWSFGPNPPPPPGIVMTINKTTLTAGDQLTVDVTVQPVSVSQGFDAWAVIIGGGATYSMVLNKPTQVRGGSHPLISGMKKLTSQFSGQLLNIQIPPGVTGSYNVIVGLVPSGQKPSVGNVIPGYLDQKTVTVQ